MQVLYFSAEFPLLVRAFLVRLVSPTDFSDGLPTDFRWTDSKSAVSPLEMTIKYQRNSSGQSQRKSDGHPTDSVTVIVIIII
jgi:hypothetical protein